MKRIVMILIMPLFFLLSVNSGFSQSSPPPPPGGHGQSGNQPAGGGAPIGSGYFILTILGAAYGLKKWYNVYRKDSFDE